MKRKAEITAILVMVTACIGFLLFGPLRSPSTSVFCDGGLEFAMVHERYYVMQDQGGPGPDDCDGPSGTAGTVDYDCTIHDEHGHVIAHLKPNQPDGHCGAGGDVTWP